MVDELRAETLGRAAENERALAALQGAALQKVVSAAGCNMLFVYLLNRWGGLFERGKVQEIERSEAFHSKVVDAYLAAGCAVDEAVPSGKLYQHTPPTFRYQVKLAGKLSPHSFARFLLRALSEDMFPEAYQQLQRLDSRLTQHLARPLQALPRVTLTVAHAFLVSGVRLLLQGLAAVAAEREAAAACGLQIVVVGDEGNMMPTASVEAVVGQVLAEVSADVGAPIAVDRSSHTPWTAAQQEYLRGLGDIKTYLVASGPLSSAILAQGALAGAAEARGAGFVAGSDMEQNVHRQGVRGRVICQANDTARVCGLGDPDLFLMARYD